MILLLNLRTTQDPVVKFSPGHRVLANLVTSVYLLLDDPDVLGGTFVILCETPLDSSRYNKWNDNKGRVDNLNQHEEEDIAVTVDTESLSLRLETRFKMFIKVR